jgi:hypothetical protein
MLKLLALGHLLVGKTAVSLGLRPRPDGWRRVVGVGLRAEHAKFGLSAFGLTPPADGPVAALARFLRTEPDSLFRLEHTRRLTSRHRTDSLDVVELVFTPDGILAGLNPHLDPVRPTPTPAAVERATTAVIVAYNQSRHLPEVSRPIELRRAVCDDPFALRLLDAVGVCVETVEPPSRFTPPDSRTRRGLGGSHLTLIVRPTGEAVDLWAVAHHTGIDGMALQELLTRLERAWGAEGARFPTPDEFTDHPRACHMPGEREVYETVSFHDLTELLALRRRLGDAHGTAIPFVTLLLWLLGREPEFRGVKFGSTVDVPAGGRSERDVDLIALRPAEFADLPAYARGFTAAIDASRIRTGPTRRAMCDTELLPPWLHRRLLESNPKGVAETFGAVGVSVVKGAKVIVAPLSDVGFPGGFISVGSADLPATDGGRVVAVTVKGTREQAATYPAVLRRVLANLRVPAAVG